MQKMWPRNWSNYFPEWEYPVKYLRIKEVILPPSCLQRCTFSSIKALRTSPYHPQCDGLVEQFNKTLKEMLRKTAKEEGKDWDKLLPYILFAYREVPQESTGFSPFELLYGREVRGPLDVLKETWMTLEKSGENVLSYITMMREKLQSMMDYVKDHLRVASHNQKTWYDTNSCLWTFRQGVYYPHLLPNC